MKLVSRGQSVHLVLGTVLASGTYLLVSETIIQKV